MDTYDHNIPDPLGLAALRWERIELRYRLTRAGYLPHFKSGMWRGIFGHVLRDHAPRLYDQVFERVIPADHPHSRRFSTMPNPYVVSVPDIEPRGIQVGDRLTVILTLIGKAIDHVGELIPLLQTLDNRGMGPDHIPLELEGWTPMPTQQDQLWRPPTDPIRLDFQSPMLTKGITRKTRSIPLSLLVHRMAERVALLKHFHCDGPFVDDFSEVKALAETARMLDTSLYWREWPRFSRRKFETYQKGGLMGSISYRLVHPQLLPLLRVGQYLHVGKGTVWGMGKMAVEELGG